MAGARIVDFYTLISPILKAGRPDAILALFNPASFIQFCGHPQDTGHPKAFQNLAATNAAGWRVIKGIIDNADD
jgi:hypothetical protein